MIEGSLIQYINSSVVNSTSVKEIISGKESYVEHGRGVIVSCKKSKDPLSPTRLGLKICYYNTFTLQDSYHTDSGVSFSFIIYFSPTFIFWNQRMFTQS